MPRVGLSAESDTPSDTPYWKFSFRIPNPMPFISRFEFSRDFFIRRLSLSGKVGNALPNKNTSLLQSYHPPTTPLFPIKRYRNFKPLPFINRFIFLRDFYIKRLRKKVGNALPNKNTASLHNCRFFLRNTQYISNGNQDIGSSNRCRYQPIHIFDAASS